MPPAVACVTGLVLAIVSIADARADGSSRELASYYDRHMALVDGVAYGWSGRGAPRRMRTGVVQVGVARDAYYALQDDGTLVAWTDAPDRPAALMPGVAWFAAGESGWFAVDRADELWRGGGGAPAPRRIAEGVIAACIGDGTDYFVTRDGTLHVKGLAHRGQYGDGRLSATTDFAATARDAVAVKAHTGHAIHLRRDGVVMGTGGNRYGPLSSHGLGDKADRWGPLLDRTRAIATGSRHSAAIREDGTLWVWGGAFAIAPAQVMEGVVAVAAGDTATIARTKDGTVWQWDGNEAPRRLAFP